jgi:rubrerythrin
MRHTPRNRRWIGTTIGCTAQVVLILLALLFGNNAAFWGWASSAPSGGPNSALFQTRSNWFCSASLICIGAVFAIIIWMMRRARPSNLACRTCGYRFLPEEQVCPHCSQPTACPTCGYSLERLPASIALCPECGTSRRPSAAKIDAAVSLKAGVGEVDQSGSDAAPVQGWFWRGMGCVIQIGLLAVVVVAFVNIQSLGWGPWLLLTLVSVASMVGISVAAMLRGAPETVCDTCGYAFLVPGEPCPQCGPRVAKKIDWCEACGYTLEGLPFGSVRCPECGVQTLRAADPGGG